MSYRCVMIPKGCVPILTIKMQRYKLCGIPNNTDQKYYHKLTLYMHIVPIRNETIKMPYPISQIYPHNAKKTHNCEHY